MKKIKNLIDRIFKIDFWEVNLSEMTLKEFFKSKGSIYNNKIKIKSSFLGFFADPFIIKKNQNEIKLLVEDFSFFSGGKISLIKKKGKIYKRKILLRGKHFSYPFVMKYNKKLLIVPEMTEQQENKTYLFNGTKIIKEKKYLLGHKVIDPTICKIGKLYWLFCALQISDNKINNNLYLFYSSNPFDNWISHKQNPVLKNKRHSRPGGSIIKYKNELYRPSQNSTENSYGNQLIINKIIKISKYNYSEKQEFKIKPPYNFDGIHHLSFLNGLFAFDLKKNKYTLFKSLYYILKLLKN